MTWLRTKPLGFWPPLVLLALGAISLRVSRPHAPGVNAGWGYWRLSVLSESLGWTNLAKWASIHSIKSSNRALTKAMNSGQVKPLHYLLPPGGDTPFMAIARAREIAMFCSSYQDRTHVTLYVWTGDVAQVQALAKSLGWTNGPARGWRAGELVPKPALHGAGFSRSAHAPLPKSRSSAE